MEKCGLFCPTSLPSFPSSFPTFQSSSFPTFLSSRLPSSFPIFLSSLLPFFLSSSRLPHPHRRFVAGAAVKGEVREKICQT